MMKEYDMNNFFIDQFMDEYPNAFHRIVELGMTNFDVWYLFERDQALDRYHGLENRYPNRKLIPFAKRDDCDDIACFEIGKKGKVQLIHDFASPGWEQKGEYNDLWGWLEDAIKEMIDYNREEDEYRECAK